VLDIIIDSVPQFALSICCRSFVCCKNFITVVRREDTYFLFVKILYFANFVLEVISI